MNDGSMWRTPAAQPVGNRIATSSLVRRLVNAHDDPGKQRIRARLSDICDEKLLNFGLSAADIALLRAPNRNVVPLPTQQMTARMKDPALR
jgi:hypothetical protein